MECHDISPLVESFFIFHKLASDTLSPIAKNQPGLRTALP
jgi:hypothetical protein